MGIDPGHILNHDLYYSNVQELTDQLSERTGLPVFLGIYDMEGIDRSKLPPEDFDGWAIYSEFPQSHDQCLRESPLFELWRHSPEERYETWFSPRLLDNDRQNERYMGRWFKMEYYGRDYYAKSREAVYTYYSQFGATEMITFCDDYYPEWLAHLNNGWTMQQLIEWAKETLIFVDFINLDSFKFPPIADIGYYKICIYDNFEDLKAFR